MTQSADWKGPEDPESAADREASENAMQFTVSSTQTRNEIAEHLGAGKLVVSKVTFPAL